MLRSRLVRLLEVDPDLGATIPAHAQESVRQALVVPAVALDTGPVDVRELARPHNRLLCVLLLDGVMTGHLRLAGRECSRMLGPGDLISPVDDGTLALPAESSLRVEQGATVALIDEHFLAAATRWPQLMQALHARVAQQAHEIFLHQAIAQLPRVEDRLLAVFWSLASRWGRVGPDGVVLRLKLSHSALGRLIGARRPTVSLGIKTLVAEGLLEQHADGWLLQPQSLGRLDAGGAVASRPQMAPVTPAVSTTGVDRATLNERLRRVSTATVAERERSTLLLASSQDACATSRENRRRRRSAENGSLTNHQAAEANGTGPPG